ncbi:hypothetical protein AYO44_05515 [Planctomycetaceae bacterium SCGC AG-212-F19]|nr:hypothetical protein AYO44_05515 [Planctomycetaceae bacterium SCGC AG-212-F19]
MQVPELAIRPKSHPGFHATVCCLCGGGYQKQYVAGVLYWEGIELGEACPRCLKLSPAAAAPGVLKGITTAGIAAGPGRARLAALLAGLDQWPFSVDELVQAERSALQTKYRFLSEADLCVLVDHRYKLMLVE